MAVVGGGTLVAWPLYVQFFGPAQVHGPIFPAEVYSADLATFVAPTELVRLDPLGLGHLVEHATGNLVENSGYLGLPLLLVAGYVGIRCRNDPVVMFSLFMALVTAVFSLGPYLNIASSMTRIPMPWMLVSKAPVLENILPARLSVYVMLFIALLVARWLTGLRATSLKVRAATAVTIGSALIFLTPNRPLAYTTTPTQPEFFTTSAVDAIPPGSVVAVAPRPNGKHPDAMLWQARAGMEFAIIGGYGNITPGYEYHLVSKTFDAIEDRAPLPEGTSSMRDDLQRIGVSVVLVGPNMQNRDMAVTTFTSLLGRPPQRVGEVDLWRICGDACRGSGLGW